MPAWFSKVFKEKKSEAETPPVPPPVAVSVPEPEEAHKPRRVVNAPVIVDEAEAPAQDGAVRLKAKADPYGSTITLLADRPLLEGHSLWCPDKDTAYRYSPLAGALFDTDGVSSVQLYGTTLTIMRALTASEPWEEAAKEFGAVVRGHLDAGKPVVVPEFLAEMPPSDEIRAALQRVIDEEINPGIASHSGVITLTRMEGNTAYILMGGGCQGCAASTITLRQGVESAFREACPWLGALLDETDHEAGQNPYFKELPAGMGG